MTTLPIEQLNIYLWPAKLNYSSDSSIDATDKIVEEIIATKFLFLKKQIGDELFNQLSYSDKLFMAETAGSIYCDANFVIAYGAKATKQPELQRQAQALFARLLISQCKICVSALTFDEAWNGIRKELGPKTVSNSVRYKLSRFIEKFGLRLANYGASEFSYREIFNDLHSFTANLLNSNKIEVIQFNN